MWSETIEHLKEDQKLVLTVKETMIILGLSRNAVYLACQCGELPTLRCG